MTVERVTVARVRCGYVDGCPAALHSEVLDDERVLAAARERGWVADDVRVRCPRHEQPTGRLRAAAFVVTATGDCGWRCSCGAENAGFASERAARRAADEHDCVAAAASEVDGG